VKQEVALKGENTWNTINGKFNDTNIADDIK
jgi:hypothetical protein